jgi:hypothetical protein
MHGPIGDSEPMAFFDCPRGHRVAPETRVFSNTGLTFPMDASPRNRASQEPTGTARKNGSPGWNGLSARGAQAACDFK